MINNICLQERKRKRKIIKITKVMNNIRSILDSRKTIVINSDPISPSYKILVFEYLTILLKNINLVKECIMFLL